MGSIAATSSQLATILFGKLRAAFRSALDARAKVSALMAEAYRRTV